MNIEELPIGTHPPALNFDYFPTRFQAVIWRNWGLIPTDRVAQVLRTEPKTINAAAEEMGLPAPAPDVGYWPTRGYSTIIRKNWHLLPYPQLLELLDWDADRMAFILKEDDFLWHKLGDLKPATPAVYYAPLTPVQRCQTAKLRKTVARYFPDNNKNAVPGFDFISKFKTVSTTNKSINTVSIDDGCCRQTRLDDTWQLILPTGADRHLRAYTKRWLTSLAERWNLPVKLTDTPTQDSQKCVTMEIIPEPGAPEETHSVDVSANSIRITAVDSIGLMRGLTYLTEQITRQGARSLPIGSIRRKTRFEWRCVYPYYLLYGDPLADPEFVNPPIGLFEEYARLGINGIWLQGMLYQLSALPRTPKFDADREKRISALRKLADKAADFGIGVYLYLNEPRCMPLAFFDKFPEWRGETHPNGLWAGMCTSHPEVREYARESAYNVYRNIPELSGAFIITMSENLTNCWSKCPAGTRPECPRCRDRDPAEVVGEINRTLAEGIFNANPHAKVISWTWGWARAFDVTKAIKHLAPGTMLMCTSEEAMPLEKGGVRIIVSDYTMSNPGPGKRALEQWELARAHGLKAAAKVQFNNTWECPAIPWLPAMDLVCEHLDNLQNTSASGLLLSWTLGGYPSFNFKLASRYYWDQEGVPIKHNRLAKLLDDDFGADAALLVQRALRYFSSAFREFPFELRVAYSGPQNPGPANLLYETPTGYSSTMVGFPYDALNSWRGSYPAPVFEEQFRKLSVGWRKGLPLLAKASICVSDQSRDELAELERMAWGTWLHFRSAYLQIKFIRLRDSLPELPEPDRTEAGHEFQKILREEIELARRLHGLAARDSTIGFEATNQYAYSTQDLMEKALNCDWLLTRMRNVFAAQTAQTCR